MTGRTRAQDRWVGGRGRGPSGAPVVAAVSVLLLLSACSPTVRVEAPADPIEINLNVRIDQQVRVQIDRELDQVFQENPDIF